MVVARNWDARGKLFISCANWAVHFATAYVVKTLLQDALEVNKEVDVPAALSWMTGFYESSQQIPNANFTSTLLWRIFLLAKWIWKRRTHFRHPCIEIPSRQSKVS